MAVPVVESSSTTAFATSATSIVITKPSGLEIGDLLIGTILYMDSGSSNSLTSPAGWTNLQVVDMSDSFRRLYVVYKVATSTETAASNFTFNLAVSGTIGGGLIRVSGVASGAEIQTSEKDSYSGSQTVTINFTGTTTPSYTDSLVMMVLAAYQNNAATTIGSYTTTPSKTWTEVYEVGNTTTGPDPIIGVATATAGDTSQITAYGATMSQAKDTHGGVLLVITPPQSATGTNALLSVSPTLFAPTASAGTTGTNALLEVSPTMFDQSGEGLQPTTWTTTPKS